ncbi:spore germination protein [Paenibacillus sp. SI8]|uniref:spore germination protein n=1 Tax=unclassified Paenibacillus TaxID=185978 RepID=UPI0034663266
MNLRKLLFRSRKSHRETTNTAGNRPQQAMCLHTDLTENLQMIRQQVGNSSDVIIREMSVGQAVLRVAAIYTEGLANETAVGDFIKNCLMIDGHEALLEGINPPSLLFDFIKRKAVTLTEIRTFRNWNELMLAIISGETVILIDGCEEAISGCTRGGEMRAISEPSTQVVIRGPKDSFTESLTTNLSLIRRRIQSPNLWIETMRIGRVTQTNTAIVYINGIITDELVQEVKQRLSKIDIDGILDTGNVEEYIQDQTFTPFPTLFNTERPDSVAGNLLEGRIAILVDGSPFVLIAPTVFAQFFQSPEDYFHRYDIASFIRLLRYASFFISLTAPSIYIAAITFHQEMIPTTLLINLAASREGVPLPALIEAISMEISFEVLREAGIRMPRAVGQAVSIVGALVLGQAAVQAGIVSPAMVIIVAITGIASFSTPSYDVAISARLIRFALMILAASFGFYGITLGLIILVAHMNGIRSFGIPYLAPFSPFILKDQKDAIFRFPLWSQRSRPRLVSQKNRSKQQGNLQPSPYKDDNESQEDST